MKFLKLAECGARFVLLCGGDCPRLKATRGPMASCSRRGLSPAFAAAGFGLLSAHAHASIFTVGSLQLVPRTKLCDPAASTRATCACRGSLSALLVPG